MNGCVKAVLELDALRKKREERYDRFIRPLDRKRDQLAALVATRSAPSAAGTRPRRGRILARINANGRSRIGMSDK